MSTPASPEQSPSIQATQRQLDELDALIQRMLTLPASLPPEDIDAPLPLPPVTEPLASRVVSASATAVSAVGSKENALPSQPAVARTAFPDEVPNRTTLLREPAAKSSQPAQEPLAAPAYEAWTASTLPRWSAAGQRQSWWLRVLIQSNRTFDRCTVRLGSPGRWLRGQQGKGLLGWVGLALLATALAWGILDWIGWSW